MLVQALYVLLQEDREEMEHPISYFSCKFDKHQRNYSTYKKETLALVLALLHFDFYLNGFLYKCTWTIILLCSCPK